MPALLLRLIHTLQGGWPVFAHSPDVVDFFFLEGSFKVANGHKDTRNKFFVVMLGDI